MEVNEKNILNVLNRRFLSSPKYLFNNLYIYKWESDYLAITSSLYSYEIEVKISIEDYRNDFKKKEKHRILYNSFNGSETSCPNYFYYACPVGLIHPDNVPPYAGLLHINVEKPYYQPVWVKKAPLLHKTKFDIVKYKIADKCYYNMWAWKKKFDKLKLENPEESRKKLIRLGAEAVRSSAIKAFAGSCPHVRFPYGSDFPICGNIDINNNNNFVDCNLQCDRGKSFKSILK